MAKQPMTEAQRRQAYRRFIMQMLFRQFGLLILAVVVIVCALIYRYVINPEASDAPDNQPSVEAPAEPDEEAVGTDGSSAESPSSGEADVSDAEATE